MSFSQMIKKFGYLSIALILVLGVLLVSCAPNESIPETPMETQEPMVESPEPAETLETPATEPLSGDPQSVDDFEIHTLPAGTDENGLSIGFVTWGDNASTVSIRTVEIPEDDAFAKPEQSGPNRVLALTADVSGWGGLTHNFTNETLDAWLTMDWSTSEGVSFWFYGLDTGTSVFFEIQENRNPDSNGNDVEIWSYPFVDDFEGWQEFKVPWEDFSRKEIGNGAPNDGLGLREVHGWAFGALTTPDEVTFYLDDVMLYGERDPLANIEVAFDQSQDTVREGGKARLMVNLTSVMEEEVSVGYHIQNGQAVLHKDYEPLEGRLVFEPGTITQQIVLQTIEDEKQEPLERLSVVLTDAEGVNLGFAQRLVLTITDDDQAPDLLLKDIETAHTFSVDGDGRVSVVTLSEDDEASLPGQGAFEDVLAASAAGESLRLTQMSPVAQDWSNASGINFWYYGTSSGETVEVELVNNPAVTTSEVEPADWTVQWSDEFEGAAGTLPDPALWKPEIADGLLNGITGWGNAELEYYTGQPENAALDGNGNLVIKAEALPEDTDLRCWYGPCEFTSARLVTQDRYEFTYGRVEARMILPEGNGIWPAFWMLGNNINEVSWPQSGEVDIMEFIGRVPDRVYGTLHGPGYSGANGAGNEYEIGSQISDTFHVYAIEWEPEEIRWYVDDVLFSTITAEDVSGQWVYDHPFFIILNLAVGGQWPGNPDETTVFPQSLVVDYVRVYGAGDTHERFATRFVDDFTGWQQVSLPFSDFKRSTIQPSGAPNDGLDLTQIFGYGLVLPGSENEMMLDQFSLFE